MAGATNNTNFLAGANETIRAINDQDVSANIDDLTAAVAALNVTVNRLAAAADVTPLIQPPNAAPSYTVPDLQVDPPPGTHATWESYLCGAGYVFCDSVAEMANRIAAIDGTLLWGLLGLVGVIGGLFGLAGGPATFAVALAYVAGLWSIIGALGENFVLDDVMANIAGEMRTNTALRACVAAAFRDGDGIDQKLILIRSAIDEQYTGVEAEAEVAKLMCFSEHVQALAYGVEQNGQVEWIATPIGAECQCGQPDYYNDFGTLDGDDNLWSNNSRAGNGIHWRYLAPRSSYMDAAISSNTGIWVSAVSRVDCRFSTDGLDNTGKSVVIRLVRSGGSIIEAQEIVPTSEVAGLPNTDDQALSVMRSVTFASSEVPNQIVIVGLHNGFNGVGSFRVFDIGVYNA